MRALTLTIAALAILAAGSGRAAAEDEATPPQPATPPGSPGLALGLSIGVSATGYGTVLVDGLAPGNVTGFRKAIMAVGATLALGGPSSGNLYIGHIGRALAFTGGRVLLAAAATVAVTEAIGYGDSSEADYRPGTARKYMAGALVCAAGVLALSVWETVDTYRATTQAARAGGGSLSVAPFVLPTQQGLSLAGLSLTGTY